MLVRANELVAAGFDPGAGGRETVVAVVVDVVLFDAGAPSLKHNRGGHRQRLANHTTGFVL